MITQSSVFRGVAAAVVPGMENLDDAAWLRVDAIVEQALSLRPPAVRRQLGLFLRVLGFLSVIRYGRPLQNLPLPIRAQFLEGIERSRLLLLRRGFWGLRTLILMGYYARPEAKAEIGYRASADGWGRFEDLRI